MGRWYICGLMLVTQACTQSGARTLPPGASRTEVAAGRHLDKLLVERRRLLRSPALAAYVTRLGRKLAARSDRPHLPWTFRVLDSDEVSASALLGGYVYVARGMLVYLNSEAELAALLCHEIAHIEARHYLILWDGFWTPSDKLKLSRRRPFSINEHWLWLRWMLPHPLYQHQLEADELGMRCLRRGGYPRRAMFQLLDMLQRVKSHESLVRLPSKGGKKTTAPHPAARRRPDHRRRELSTRMRRARKLLGPRARRQIRSDPSFLRRLRGLVVPPTPAHGTLVGRRYFHLRGGFRLDVPRGWRSQLRPHHLVATQPDGRATLVVYRAPQPTPREAVQALRVNAWQASPTLSDGQLARSVSGRGRFGGDVRAQALAFMGRASRQVFVVMLLAPDATWSQLQVLRSALYRSVRSLPRRLPARARGWQIRTLQSPRSQTLAGWTTCAPDEESLRLALQVNRLEPATRLERGRWIKCLQRGPGRPR